MEDAQKSQPISTEIQWCAEQTIMSPGKVLPDAVEQDEPPWLVGETSLGRIRRLAADQPDLTFTSLSHRIDLGLLKDAFRRIRKSKSAGVDKVTAAEYAVNLDENLYNLYQRLRRGQYVAMPVKRIWLEKEDGRKRPIGIPALEDKIVQKAVEAILYAVFDVDFYEFSHGFRKGHSRHKAISDLRNQCIKCNVNWIIDADVSGFFDNINHNILQDVIKQRVNDGGIRRLIGKWLNAGVMDQGNLSYPESGTPQGGVISPMLANIFLHNVLDDWFVKEVEPRMKGRCCIIRWADDFVLGFEVESDARRVMEVLPKRFERFDLSLNMDKTKLIPFMKPSKTGKYKPETFTFLGFTFYWGKSRKGYLVIKKKTARKRMVRFMKAMWQWCKENRHMHIVDQYNVLCAKLQGYYQYYGVTCNYEALKRVFMHTQKAWRYWLSRRCNKGWINVEKFKQLKERFPLPMPRIFHNI